MKFIALIAALALTAGCSQTTQPTSAEETPTKAAIELKVVDPWVKATKQGEMTAAFATLTNESDQSVTVEKASSDISMMVELHEVVMKDGEMVMTPKEGGFEIKAGQSIALEPGGLHIMFMGVNKDLKPGDDVHVTLHFAGGGSQEIHALVKNFTGANEKYNKKKKGM